MMKPRTRGLTAAAIGAVASAIVVAMFFYRTHSAAWVWLDRPIPFCEAYARPRHGDGLTVIATGDLIGSFEGHAIRGPDCNAWPAFDWVGDSNDPAWKQLGSALIADSFLPDDNRSISGDFIGRLHVDDHQIILDVRQIDHLRVGPPLPPLKPDQVTFIDPPSFAFAQAGAPTTEMVCYIVTNGHLRFCSVSPDAKPQWASGWERSADALVRARVSPTTRNSVPTRGRDVIITVPLTDDRKVAMY